MKPLTMSGRARTIAVAAACLAAACSRGDSAKKDSTVAADSSKKAPAALAAVPGGTQASEPGALPKRLDQMTGEELYIFTQGLRFGGGHERARVCRGRAACRGPRPTDSTRLAIAAVEGEDSLSVGTLRTNGVVAARVLNKGTLADSMYNTRPGAQYEYFYVVVPQAPGLATWSLVELDTTAGARAHRTIATGRFHECGHGFRRGARADFKTCAQAQATNASFSMRRTFQTDPEAPIWIGCAAGCCTADGPDGRG